MPQHRRPTHVRKGGAQLLAEDYLVVLVPREDVASTRSTSRADARRTGGPGQRNRFRCTRPPRA
eukprot:13745374-Alexandrium_andersonii.AAC.1